MRRANSRDTPKTAALLRAAVLDALERPLRRAGLDIRQIPEGDSYDAFTTRQAMAAGMLMNRRRCPERDFDGTLPRRRGRSRIRPASVQPCRRSSVIFCTRAADGPHDGGMDWISPLSGLVGALIGGGASLYGSRLSLTAQLNLKVLEMEAARRDQEDAERGRIAGLLGPRLTGLTMFLRTHGLQHEDGSHQSEWPLVVTEAELAALEVPDRELRELFVDAFDALRHWDRSLRYVNQGREPVQVIHGIVDHLVQCLFAWRRGDALPEPSPAFTHARQSWGIWMDERTPPSTE